MQIIVLYIIIVCPKWCRHEKLIFDFWFNNFCFPHANLFFIITANFEITCWTLKPNCGWLLISNHFLPQITQIRLHDGGYTVASIESWINWKR